MSAHVAMSCPRCTADLAPVSVVEHVLVQCPVCFQSWWLELKVTALASAIAARDVERPVVVERHPLVVAILELLDECPWLARRANWTRPPGWRPDMAADDEPAGDEVAA